jgi:hypothetical protein
MEANQQDTAGFDLHSKVTHTRLRYLEDSNTVHHDTHCSQMQIHSTNTPEQKNFTKITDMYRR